MGENNLVKLNFFKHIDAKGTTLPAALQTNLRLTSALKMYVRICSCLGALR